MLVKEREREREREGEMAESHSSQLRTDLSGSDVPVQNPSPSAPCSSWAGQELGLGLRLGLACDCRNMGRITEGCLDEPDPLCPALAKTV